ncbi:caspase-3-like [Eurosta solidaginis]|uniref:caspase-3-like n=1 Tax=Eurosta solidaginis TaxID=178769 RepID=UPI00353163AF
MDERDIFFFGSKKIKKKTTATNLQRDPQHFKESKPQVIISRPTAEVDYGTDNPHVGLAIVLNQKYVKGQTVRKGTEKDGTDIKASLENYGFEVRVYNDLTRNKISQLLKSVAAEDHSQFDCFVLVAMTHGDKGKIGAADEFYSTEELWEPLLGEKCPTLLGKPKIFFIQACRGKRVDEPVMMRIALRSAFSSRSESYEHATYAIPSTADLLVMYSTFEDYYSFRNSVTGSWFIQSLCSILNESAKAEEAETEGVEFFRLLTAVNRKVAYEYQSYHTSELYDQKKEMPNFMSTLTKTFYLKRKHKKVNPTINAIPEVEGDKDEDDKNKDGKDEDDKYENDTFKKIDRIFNQNKNDLIFC